jgi:alpha-beta hydrolase superfamily lysophospholipase
MGLTMGHDGPGGPVEGYETVPLLIAGAVGSANRRGVTVLRRRTPRPSKRAVVYVHCLDDSFVPADLARWYTDRGFDFYAADLRAVGGGGPGTADASRTAGELNRYFASLDAAITHLRAADAIETVVVSAHSAGALFAALWCHARRGSRPVDTLILAGPELGSGRP